MKSHFRVLEVHKGKYIFVYTSENIPSVKVIPFMCSINKKWSPLQRPLFLSLKVSPRNTSRRPKGSAPRQNSLLKV